MSQTIILRNVPGRYGIVRMAPDAPLPDWADGPGLVAMVRADDELTIVCPMERIPSGSRTDGPWSCLRSIGPFPFNATGIVQSLVNPLSDAGIGVFVLCTFDGEHLLVAESDAVKALALLTCAGFQISPEKQGD